MKEINSQLQEQAAFFASGATRSLSFRIEALKKMKSFLESHEDTFVSALEQDLGKPKFEALGGELLPVYQEIDLAIDRLFEWAKVRPRATPLLSYSHIGTKSFLLPEPLGHCLLIGPWNYPLYLNLIPLVSAVAAGNVISLKPSEHAPASSKMISSCIGSVFDPGHVSCFLGGVETSQALLKKAFDKIFFTGSSKVGVEVLKAAAPHLTPVTLELGGKSPCILDRGAVSEANLKKILWAKCYNAGQTCVAPDYLLFPQEAETQILELSQKILKGFYPQGALSSKDFGRIVNRTHYDRLHKILKESKVVLGGEARAKSLQIEPTLIRCEAKDDAAMEEEIFGPLFPMIAYGEFEEVYEWVHSYEKALVIYFFSSSKKKQQEICERTSSGSLVINDTMVHMTHTDLPFGGVGKSGMGRYHGEFGFDDFSHLKAVETKSWGPHELRYPPYVKEWTSLRRRFF